MIDKFLPFVIVFALALVTTLILTPLVREFHRHLGMVDKPDPRRINKVPIPRGGGVAVVLGSLVPYVCYRYFTGSGFEPQTVKLIVLGVAVAALGLTDDRFSLSPKVKLGFQLAIAILSWAWAGLGFHLLWPSLPAWLDLVLTVFWITGAINAFNLIDGLDGLASGIALIAALGMAGALFFVQSAHSELFYLAFAGSLLGFLRYNYHPASVFLGDSGSMFIGFILSTLPLVAQDPNSFLVSIGMPLLAMGVPIFDTSLAILRRTLRRLLQWGSGNSTKVMSADTDHLHHRLLRASGMNQRRTAWMLYALTLFGVVVGLVAMYLKSRAGGLWLLAVAVATVVVFKDAAIEMFDAGRILNQMAHTHSVRIRRRLAQVAVPVYLTLDLLILLAALVISCRMLSIPLDRFAIERVVPVRVIAMFLALVSFKTYVTIWPRALGTNYFRLLLATLAGSLVSAIILYYWPGHDFPQNFAVSFVFALFSFVGLYAIRQCRSWVRDIFYALDCNRLKAKTGVSRIVVYGSGLRYQAFRRELVRTTSANDRMIVGLIDDDLLLKNKYIGGIRVYGTIGEAPAILKRLRADAVVIACEITPEWQRIVWEILQPTGVKVSMFSFAEAPFVEECRHA